MESLRGSFSSLELSFCPARPILYHTNEVVFSSVLLVLERVVIVDILNIQRGQEMKSINQLEARASKPPPLFLIRLHLNLKIVTSGTRVRLKTVQKLQFVSDSVFETAVMTSFVYNFERRVKTRTHRVIPRNTYNRERGR